VEASLPRPVNDCCPLVPPGANPPQVSIQRPRRTGRRRRRERRSCLPPFIRIRRRVAAQVGLAGVVPVSSPKLDGFFVGEQGQQQEEDGPDEQ
jgi:hypothetical protein